MHIAFASRGIRSILFVSLGSATFALIMLHTTGIARAEDHIGTTIHHLSAGTSVAPGELEAVGTIPGCTATLIDRQLVLTAAHCVCPDEVSADLDKCANRRTFTLRDVRPVDDLSTPVDESLARRNVSVSGDVSVHPKYTDGGWLRNDYALIRLDRTVDEVAEGVRPIPVERPEKMPAIGEVLTLVGYGPTGSACGGPGEKRRLDLPATVVNATVITFLMPGMHVCPGDSGGPTLNAAGHVVGVASWGDLATNSNYRPTATAYPWLFGTDQVHQVAGKPTFLRIHDVGTSFGPSTDPIDGEVIVKLDSDRDAAFGFQLRTDGNEEAHHGMLKLLRQAFVRSRTVAVDYVPTGPRNRRIIRVMMQP